MQHHEEGTVCIAIYERASAKDILSMRETKNWRGKGIPKDTKNEKEIHFNK